MRNSQEQALQSLIITGADGACTCIAAGHHQGLRGSLFRQEQMMQRRVGQHQADDAKPWR